MIFAIFLIAASITAAKGADTARLHGDAQIAATHAASTVLENYGQSALEMDPDNVQWSYGDVPLAKSELHSMLSSTASAALDPRRLLNPRTGSAATGWAGAGRSLAALTEMNELLKDVKLHVKNVWHNTDTVEFKLHDLKCKDIGIKDLTLTSTKQGTTMVDLKLALSDISVSCTIKMTIIDIPWYMTLGAAVFVFTSKSFCRGCLPGQGGPALCGF